MKITHSVIVVIMIAIMCSCTVLNFNKNDLDLRYTSGYNPNSKHKINTNGYYLTGRLGPAFALYEDGTYFNLVFERNSDGSYKDSIGFSTTQLSKFLTNTDKYMNFKYWGGIYDIKEDTLIVTDINYLGLGFPFCGKYNMIKSKYKIIDENTLQEVSKKTL